MTPIATLILLPRKVFEIKLSDGTIIKGQFGTWSLKRFCDKQNISLSEAQPKLQDLSGFADYLLCSVEYLARKEKAPFSFTDVNCCSWIDELGGADSKLFVDLVVHTTDENTTEEKKTDPQA